MREHLLVEGFLSYLEQSSDYIVERKSRFSVLLRRARTGKLIGVINPSKGVTAFVDVLFCGGVSYGAMHTQGLFEQDKITTHNE